MVFPVFFLPLCSSDWSSQADIVFPEFHSICSSKYSILLLDFRISQDSPEKEPTRYI